MATTKIWPIRDSLKRVLDYAENPDKTGYLDLRQVLEYAEDGSKTYVDDEFEDRYFISGVNCNVETAFEEMTAVKQRYGKTDGNKYQGPLMIQRPFPFDFSKNTGRYNSILEASFCSI